MEIVGRGFLAGHLAGIAGHHPDVVALAAGVSAAGDIPPEQYTRESKRLYEVLRYCEKNGKRLVFFSTASAGMYSVPDASPGREDGPVYPATPDGRDGRSRDAVADPGEPAHLGEPPVGAHHDLAVEDVPVGGGPGDPTPLVAEQGVDAAAVHVLEVRELGAVQQEFGQQMGLRYGQEVVVRGRSAR
ncbi:hypothetical protein SXANM310S_05997 [Streptomyces xanthochromogenes]